MGAIKAFLYSFIYQAIVHFIAIEKVLFFFTLQINHLSLFICKRAKQPALCTELC